jgi:hypothetical protein
MEKLEITESLYEWSTTSAMGKQLSTSLPKVVRTFEDYAKVDFALGDNDPVYFAVVQAREKWGKPWATRFCVGMLTYYHMGTAVQAADLEGQAFWKFLDSKFSTAPRGAARRHFRGANGTSGLLSMMEYSPDPNDFFVEMGNTYSSIMNNCKSGLRQMGPYFWLKIADYMDRCLEIPIKNWLGLERNLSKVPAAACSTLYPFLPVPEGFALACKRLFDLNLLAPPTYDRPVGPAEVETILCDWLHAKQGTNWLGADLIVKRLALKGCGEKADMMSNWLPPVVQKGQFPLDLQ